MLSVLRFLAAYRLKVQPHVDVEAAPPCLGHFEGWVLACAERVLVGVEDFELHFVEPGCEGGVARRLPHVDGPALCVVVGDVFGARGVAEGGEGDGFGADY